ncbi:hypothetical protein DRW03_02680 [Corallococcus sp. H22C18031201]|nr:hypothetical protein DRW03_02680 [Corallococcus sp. H22C18031201]
MTLLRAVAAVTAVLALSACGAMASDEAPMTGDDSVMESKAALGNCPGYDSCAEFSPWVDVAGSTSCGNDTGCGIAYLCVYCVAGEPQDSQKHDADPSFIPVCEDGKCLQTTGKPATFGQQTRYRVCYNPTGQSCTDRQYQTGARLRCGC